MESGQFTDSHKSTVLNENFKKDDFHGFQNEDYTPGIAICNQALQSFLGSSESVPTRQIAVDYHGLKNVRLIVTNIASFPDPLNINLPLDKLGPIEQNLLLRYVLVSSDPAQNPQIAMDHHVDYALPNVVDDEGNLPFWAFNKDFFRQRKVFKLLVDMIVALANKSVHRDGSFIWGDILGDFSSFMQSVYCDEFMRKLDACGCTIAHAIASSDRLTPEEVGDFLNYLLEHGLQSLLLIPNDEGDTPLHIAIKQGQRGLVDTFLQYSSYVAFHIPNHQGKTPLLYLALFSERYMDVFYNHFTEAESDARLLLQQFLLSDGDPKFLVTSLSQKFYSRILLTQSFKVSSHDRKSLLQEIHSSPFRDLIQTYSLLDLFLGTCSEVEVDSLLAGSGKSEKQYTRYLTKRTVKPVQTTALYVEGQGPFSNEVQIIRKLGILKLPSGYSAEEESDGTTDIDIYHQKRSLPKSKRAAKKGFLLFRKQRIENERSNNSDCDSP